MRNFLTLAVVALFTLNMNAQEIKFEKVVLDYGKIKNGANGDRVFTFKNTGSSPLIIKNSVASCDCIIPQSPKGAIAPGETGEIKVHYDTNRPGSFSKPITVLSNAKNAASKVITIKGFVANK